MCLPGGKQVRPQSFRAEGEERVGRVLSVHLWCLCQISGAREMFQRSERIPVSVERPKREHVSKGAVL